MPRLPDGVLQYAYCTRERPQAVTAANFYVAFLVLRAHSHRGNLNRHHELRILPALASSSNDISFPCLPYIDSPCSGVRFLALSPLGCSPAPVAWGPAGERHAFICCDVARGCTLHFFAQKCAAPPENKPCLADTDLVWGRDTHRKTSREAERGRGAEIERALRLLRARVRRNFFWAEND